MGISRQTAVSLSGTIDRSVSPTVYYADTGIVTSTGITSVQPDTQQPGFTVTNATGVSVTFTNSPPTFARQAAGHGEQADTWSVTVPVTVSGGSGTVPQVLNANLVVLVTFVSK
jgi:hypothetical protein